MTPIPVSTVNTLVSKKPKLYQNPFLDARQDHISYIL